MTVNIVLKQFKMTNDEIVQLIKQGDHTKIGAGKLKGLGEILPHEFEVTKTLTDFRSSIVVVVGQPFYDDGLHYKPT